MGLLALLLSCLRTVEHGHTGDLVSRPTPSLGRCAELI